MKFSVLNKSYSAVLCVTGVATVLAGLGNARILDVADPIIGLRFRQLFFVIGTVGIFIALAICFAKKPFTTNYLVAWFASTITVYRIGIWWVHWRRSCSCLGNFTDALYITPRMGDTLMKATLGYLLMASYVALYLLWRGMNSVAVIKPTPE